jgi:hypothetical protein
MLLSRTRVILDIIEVILETVESTETQYIAEFLEKYEHRSAKSSDFAL